jgi:hypothetical protein
MTNNGDIRDAILQVLPEAIKRASKLPLFELRPSKGPNAFSLRNLYYHVRILTKADYYLREEPSYNYFCSVITYYENEYAEIENLIRQ